MERNANYALVGFVTLLLFIGMVIFVVWLARVQFAKEYDIYDIVFVGPVDGLSVGGEVHFNGIKLGEVTKIALDKADPKKVIAQARVTSDVPIRVDSYASLEPQGITGVNYVQISAGTVSKPLLKDVTPPGEIPVLQSRSSTISNLLQGGGTVLAAAVDALNRVNRVLSDENIKSLTASIHNVEDVTSEIRNHKQILADADSAVKSIQQTSQSIDKLSESGRQLVDGDGRRAVHDIADAAEQIKAAGVEAHQLLAKLQGPAGDFATNGLPQLTSAVVSLQQTSESLNRLVSEIEQNPRSLVGKAPSKEVQVKP